MLEGCLFQFKFWGVNRTSSHILGSWQVSVQGLTNNPYKCGFFDSSSKVLCLSSHYAKIVYTGMMTCDVRMLINWKRSFEGFFKFLH